MARRPDALAVLHEQIVECRACPRLTKWREEVAREKRRAYRDQEYWGRPVTGFGDRAGAVVIVGLAPAAHGANRTGRVFTGDRSGDFLFAALHRAGVANQPESVSRDDGLALSGAYVVAPVRCAPPENKPTPAEFARCAGWLDAELALLPEARVFLALGAHAWRATLEHLERAGVVVERPRPEFAHGAVARFRRGPTGQDEIVVAGSYHVSQQNTQTGRLTPAMFDAVVATALRAALPPSSGRPSVQPRARSGGEPRTRARGPRGGGPEK